MTASGRLAETIDAQKLQEEVERVQRQIAPAEQPLPRGEVLARLGGREETMALAEVLGLPKPSAYVVASRGQRVPTRTANPRAVAAALR
jgi:hypothetical protein